MTATQSPAAPGAGIPTEAARRDRGRGAGRRILLGLLVGVVLLSLTRILSGANDITTGGAFGAAISLAIPIMLAGLGGLWSERAGIVNIGLEGMLILGTWFGAAFAYFSGSPWLGVVGGIVGGLLGGLVHAIATITFGVDQIVSGVAVTILAGGIARYLAGVFFTGQPGGGPTQSPGVPTFQPLRIPGAQDAFIDIERHRWFFVSDVAGLLRAITTTLTPFSILMILVVPLSGFVLWRTRFGLRLRACGENPAEAETLGVKVYSTKYVAVLVSGALAGLGGAFLADLGGLYREGQTGGRGYIGLAAMIFGNWRPGGLAAGAALFGYTDAVQQRQGSVSVHALLLLVALLLAVLVAYQLFLVRRFAALVTAAATAGFFVWYLLTDSVPIEFVPATPYIITLLVLALASQRLRPPAADGLPWRRGQGA